MFLGEKPDELFQIKDIAEACNIPRKFLETILLDLKRAAIVSSKQGSAGGYALRKDPADINLADVVRLFDGAIAAVPCATFKFYESCDECEDEATCSVRLAFLELRNETVEKLKSHTISDLILKQNKLKQRKKR